MSASFWWNTFIGRQLSRRTSIFGLRLYVVIAILAVAVLFLFIFLLCLCLCSRRRRRSRKRQRYESPPLKSMPNPNLQPEIQFQTQTPAPPLPRLSKEAVNFDQKRETPRKQEQIRIDPLDIDVEKGEGRDGGGGGGVGGQGPPQVSHLGWGHCFTLKELQEATNGMAEKNVLGEGGYGIVYKGMLADNTMIAIKNLLNNKGQAEKEFKAEVEAIGRVRHKHLVRLLGYCVEGEHRMLVYEYIDNGNLDQWLHGDVGEVSPLTWEIRMNIILGTAKGLAYLHDGLEPKIVHRDIKASNILLDRQWHPKISDFGLAKSLGSEMTYVSTRVMGTFGYVAPEYCSTGMLTERSDVYSFGVLIMEIISGRTPVDYRRPAEEVHLVEWLKTMVGDRKTDQVLDPKMLVKPSSKALKRVLLIALRCIDPESKKRPNMGNVIHMLEMDDLLFHSDNKLGQQAPTAPSHHLCDSSDTPASPRYNKSDLRGLDWT